MRQEEISYQQENVAHAQQMVDNLNEELQFWITKRDLKKKLAESLDEEAKEANQWEIDDAQFNIQNIQSYIGYDKAWLRE